ncbi:MAG: aminotransferase class III-fold pyridoxal phosphate-dependent enzyme [Actinobacteria bacterium]|nr:aminotransferase class III-fold pyridoxal phosphate-dependent enzyme [Actinomycetota bacterium]
MSGNSKLLISDFNVGRSNEVQIGTGEGVFFVLKDGRRVIDGSNTGASLGHRHPDMVAAVKAAAEEPVVNDGWYWPGREAAIDELIETAFGGDATLVGAVRFALSGGEANDLALSLAQALTGRAPLVTRERAYHGINGLAREMTVQPHWHGGLSSTDGGVRPAARLADVRQLPMPRGARIKGAEEDLPAHELRATAVELMKDSAAVIVDYTQGGIYHSPEFQDTVADAARETGTLWIADEVVTGFGRTGSWFGFEGGERRPDIITLGKPLAGGAAPAGAVLLSQRVAEMLDHERWQTFSTFRGHPVMIAAMRAHLKVHARDDLVGHIRELDAVFAAGLAEIAERHPSVTRVDGRGAHWTVELEGPDWRGWRADVAEAPLASRVANRALDAGALIGTSGEQTSLFLAPPFIVEEPEVRQLLDALDQGLALADEELEESKVTSG